VVLSHKERGWDWEGRDLEALPALQVPVTPAGSVVFAGSWTLGPRITDPRTPLWGAG
jgi:hypothetical protein